MKKKVEEILPELMRSLSQGIAVSTEDIAEKYKLSASSIRNHLHHLQNSFYQNCYRYDASTKKWVCTEANFLQKRLLQPEEVIILNSMIRGKESLGPSLSNWHEKMVDNYVKRTSSFIFKQHITEAINAAMEEKFALIQNAIAHKNKLKINLYGFDRIVLPYKIINLEYYWYVIGLEESCEKMGAIPSMIKSFTISKIGALEILHDEAFEYDFTFIDGNLEHAMNAFFSPSQPLLMVELYITEQFSEYVDRALFFSAWKKTRAEILLKDIKYIKYEVKITDPEYREIIPTILKYLPQIIVESPLELREKINMMFKEYQDIYT